MLFEYSVTAVGDRIEGREWQVRRIYVWVVVKINWTTGNNERLLLGFNRRMRTICTPKDRTCLLPIAWILFCGSHPLPYWSICSLHLTTWLQSETLTQLKEGLFHCYDDDAPSHLLLGGLITLFHKRLGCKTFIILSIITNWILTPVLYLYYVQIRQLPPVRPHLPNPCVDYIRSNNNKKATFVVTLGENGTLTFTPDVVTASPGDIVAFTFPTTVGHVSQKNNIFPPSF